jgi:hypothetical protein
MSQRLALLILATILISGCARFRSDNSAGGGRVESNSNSAPPSSIAAGTPTSWQANATSLQGTEGKSFTLACSPGGTAHSVWGSDIYTSDSSICTAAVHSGLITYQQGGTVTIEVRPGRSIYGCSERNGVTTGCYGQYMQSFVFSSPQTESAVREAENETVVTWTTSAGMASGENGKSWKFKCPANGSEGSVWGTDTYTQDSSICNAAVHAGKFSRESGGTVEIELRPGESSYQGSTRNTIKTNDYGAYGRSFVVK